MPDFANYKKPANERPKSPPRYEQSSAPSNDGGNGGFEFGFDHGFGKFDTAAQANNPAPSSSGASGGNRGNPFGAFDFGN